MEQAVLALGVVIEHLEDTAAPVSPGRAGVLTRSEGGRFRQHDMALAGDAVEGAG